VANLVYAAVAVTISCVFIAAVADLRRKRPIRFEGPADAAAFAAAHDHCVGSGGLLAAVALLPIIVAIA
jgi:hypothetical protein